MAIVLKELGNGRQLHVLREEVPLRFWTPPRPPTRRVTREAAIGDDGIGITQRERLPMRTHVRDIDLLIDEGVPVIGHTDEIGGTGMIGVQVGDEYGNPLRRGSGGRDLTHLLRESDVPMTPARKRGKPFGLQADEDEADEDERELYMSAEGNEDAETGEEEEDEDESRRLTEEEARDDLCDYIEDVAGHTHATSRGLLTLAGLLRRQRRAGHAAAGMLD